MPTVLTVDPGLRNLSVCCVTVPEGASEGTIIYWANLDVLGAEPHCDFCTRPTKWTGPPGPSPSGPPVRACGIHQKRLGDARRPYVEKKLKAYSTQAIVKKLVGALLANLDLWRDLCDPDVVAIELQPTKNNKMKMVSHIVYGFFIEHIPAAQVKFVRAADKLRDVARADKKTYAQRKKKSVALVAAMLTDAHDIAFFAASRKQDDLSDVYLMATRQLSRT